MKKLIIILLVILLLCALWFEKDRIGFYGKQPSPQDSKEPAISLQKEFAEEHIISTTQKHGDWKTYTDPSGRFSIQYPGEITPEVLTEDQVVFQVIGKTQKPDTEFYDGILVSIEKKPFRGKSLLIIVKENREALLEIWGEPMSEIEETALGGYTGYTYNGSDHTYWYLMLDTEFYFEIQNLTSDPGNAGYTSTADDMIMSFQKK